MRKLAPVLFLQQACYSLLKQEDPANTLFPLRDLNTPIQQEIDRKTSMPCSLYIDR
jgi:hypothetical protein